METKRKGPPFYWCLEHGRVEGPDEDANMQRLGPYDTREEAEQALERARARSEAWEEEDRRWREGR